MLNSDTAEDILENCNNGDNIENRNNCLKPPIIVQSIFPAGYEYIYFLIEIEIFGWDFIRGIRPVDQLSIL